MEFETFEDMISEIERRTVVLDAAISNMLCFYNSMCVFVIMMNILIFIILSTFAVLTHALDGYKMLAYSLYAAIVLWEYLASSIIRIRLDKQIIQMKCDLAWCVFTHYKYFDNFGTGEDANYFERNLLKYAGITSKNN